MALKFYILILFSQNMFKKISNDTSIPIYLFSLYPLFQDIFSLFAHGKVDSVKAQFPDKVIC